jgi:hypothetical protein
MQRTMAHTSIRVNLVFPSSAGHARARPWQTPTSSLTNSVVHLHLLDMSACSPPPTLVVRGLAPAWPRLGAAVAGLCHRAAMDATMDTPGNFASFFYPFIYSIFSICLSSAY